MKIVILAAGMGSRLDQNTPAPKALTQLANGQSILETQLQALSLYLNLQDLIVAVGFHYEKVIETFPDLLYSYNPDFRTQNTAKSLLRAAKKVKDDLLFLNGDLLFHPHALKSLLNYKNNSVLTIPGTCGDEEVKYRTDSQGFITEISKKTQGVGEAVGLNFIKKEDLPLFLFHLEQCAENDYFEKAMEQSIREGVKFQAIPIEKHQACEIDFPEDLERANKLVQEWT